MGRNVVGAALMVAFGVGFAAEAPAQPTSAQSNIQLAQAKPTKPAAAAPVAAPELLGKFGDWAAYVSQTPKTKICYALSQPKDRQPASLKRDPGFMFISHRPGEGVRNEVSATMGFPLRDGDASMQIGNVVFAMTSKDENVWIKNPAEEQRLIDTMRRGKDLAIKGTSRRGNESTDRYSLSGLAQALDRVAQECK
ncbi:hypothetical protein [Blastochloris viridis]|uniref:Invasion protein B, involved in pathogenesis n=1 Tax=Blastochloris viridis TaxID=1079 RepID=A0A0P0JNQ6_BLAVI|nr:hypothetical protein [Blastochloris viridis]ALK10973.1 hypothetical protein BVIR_3216 [Blastochloris viridis]CUU43635.1 Invasion protein B, involved in pathogenesis [Blastochloris viridis]